MQTYLLSVLAGMLMTLGGLIAILLGLSSIGSLPPPQFSNSICMDEKISFMRERPPVSPDLLVVGSSVGWRHFNSPVAAAEGFKPYNAALCGASISQTEQVTEWLTRRLPSVRQVVLIVSPLDFESCSPVEPKLHLNSVDRFVFGGASPLRYYAGYFDPFTLAKNATFVRQRRSDLASFNALIMNGYGDGPVEPSSSRGLFYGSVASDPSCFASLNRMAHMLKARNVRLAVTMTPLSPDWLREHDVRGRVTARLDAGLRSALNKTNAVVLPRQRQVARSAFFDAIHIRWSHTPAFTHRLLNDLKSYQQRN